MPLAARRMGRAGVIGPGLWLGPLPPSVLSRWLRTASTVARTAVKTGETTGETAETTAETVAEQTLAQTLLVTATGQGR